MLYESVYLMVRMVLPHQGAIPVFLLHLNLIPVHSGAVENHDYLGGICLEPPPLIPVPPPKPEWTGMTVGPPP